MSAQGEWLQEIVHACESECGLGHIKWLAKQGIKAKEPDSQVTKAWYAARAERDTLAWATRRMLQALDAYWQNYEGRPFHKMPRGKYEAEDWWNRYEKYRKIVESCLAPSTS